MDGKKAQEMCKLQCTTYTTRPAENIVASKQGPTKPPPVDVVDLSDLNAILQSCIHVDNSKKYKRINKLTSLLMI